MITKIILDNGHGEDTAGKRSQVWEDGSQLFEWEFNRDIVKRISSLLEELSIPYEVLVPENKDISLNERCARANAIVDAEKANGECLLISIHANAGGGTGWEIHVYPSSEKGKEYAKKFIDEYNMSGIDFKNRGMWESNFAILRGTKCVALLLENMFMDTEKDCKYIMSNEGRQELAKFIVKSINEVVVCSRV